MGMRLPFFATFEALTIECSTTGVKVELLAVKSLRKIYREVVKGTLHNHYYKFLTTQTVSATIN